MFISEQVEYVGDLVELLEGHDVDQDDPVYVADEHRLGFSVVVRIQHEVVEGERRVVLVTRAVSD